MLWNFFSILVHLHAHKYECPFPFTRKTGALLLISTSKMCSSSSFEIRILPTECSQDMQLGTQEIQLKNLDELGELLLNM